MSVAKSGRQRGVAKQLHAALLAHAQEQQLKGVFLSTSNLQVVRASALAWLGGHAGWCVVRGIARAAAAAGAEGRDGEGGERGGKERAGRGGARMGFQCASARPCAAALRRTCGRAHGPTCSCARNHCPTLQAEAVALYKKLEYEQVGAVSSPTPIVGRMLTFLTFEKKLNL
jgi:hypothetical protein